MRYEQIPLFFGIFLAVTSAITSPHGQGQHANGPRRKSAGECKVHPQSSSGVAYSESSSSVTYSSPLSSMISASPAASSQVPTKPIPENANSGDSSAAGSADAGSTDGDLSGTGDSVTPTNKMSSSGSTSQTSISTKKGAGVWWCENLSEKVTELGVSWAYDWSATPETNSFEGSAPSNVELIPMIQSTTDLTPLATSNHTTLLGYNEPDRPAGPAVSVSTAISLWPSVLATNKRIGSPAPAETKLVPGDWFYDFMSGISKNGDHVDFICLHHYSPDGNVTAFRSYIESVHNFYSLPIWVTEWAYVDYAQDPPWVPDMDSQNAYMQEAVKMLDSLSFVERYAWFALPENESQPGSFLFGKGGEISGRGTAYKGL